MTCLGYFHDYSLINFVEHGLYFLTNIVEPYDDQVHT